MKVRLRIEFTYDVPAPSCHNDDTEDELRFFYEESTCLHNILRDIMGAEPDNECNLCTMSTVKLLEVIRGE